MAHLYRPKTPEVRCYQDRLRVVASARSSTSGGSRCTLPERVFAFVVVRTSISSTTTNSSGRCRNRHFSSSMFRSEVSKGVNVKMTSTYMREELSSYYTSDRSRYRSYRSSKSCRCRCYIYDAYQVCRICQVQIQARKHLLRK